MLNFLDMTTNIYHYYYFADDNGKLYYWKSSNSDVYNNCVQNGRLFGINALEYETKKNGKKLFHNGKSFNEIKVSKWKICA